MPGYPHARQRVQVPDVLLGNLPGESLWLLDQSRQQEGYIRSGKTNRSVSQILAYPSPDPWETEFARLFLYTARVAGTNLTSFSRLPAVPDVGISGLSLGMDSPHTPAEAHADV